MSREKCLGILGRMLGHQFVKCKGGLIYSSDCCYRCGHRKGCNG